MSERKASEILLSIESKLELLSKNVELISFNQKILLDRVNKLKLVDVPSEAAKIVSSLKEEKIEDKKDKSDITSKNKFKEITVFQKVFYPDKSPVILCKVRILNLDDKEIKVTKTVADGKWTVVLPSGSYKVHLIKEPLANNKKPIVDRVHPFVVDGSSPALELNSSIEG